MSKHFRRYQPSFVLCSEQCKKETKHLISLLSPDRNMRQPSKSIRSTSSSGNKSISTAASTVTVKSAADPPVHQVPKTNGYNGDTSYEPVKLLDDNVISIKELAEIHVIQHLI
ncbi:hypothetical protein M8J75_006349 [Diaphorina citri]|nr:hypothetical protein M8J75_006349 [Diaphorina citri]KAI5735649.1 hypothetical protein M8J77_020973 [Diaphorina citri]